MYREGNVKRACRQGSWDHLVQINLLFRNIIWAKKFQRVDIYSHLIVLVEKVCRTDSFAKTQRFLISSEAIKTLKKNKIINMDHLEHRKNMERVGQAVEQYLDISELQGRINILSGEDTAFSVLHKFERLLRERIKMSKEAPRRWSGWTCVISLRRYSASGAIAEAISSLRGICSEEHRSI